jgi:hypothetical protein
MRVLHLQLFAGMLALPSVATWAQAQPSRSQPTFALPKVQNIGNDQSQLEHHPALRRLVAARYPEAGASYVLLGALGDGAIVYNGDHTLSRCGATGNCEVDLVFMHRGHYQAINLTYGWAYAVAKGGRAVPDIFVEANMSCCSGTIERFRFIGGKFANDGCDYVEEKAEKVEADIRDPKNDTVTGCPHDRKEQRMKPFIRCLVSSRWR